MNVLYCGDKKIEKGLILSVLSLCQNTKDCLHIYVMTMEMHTNNRKYEAVSEACVELLRWHIMEKNIDSTVTRIMLDKDMADEILGENSDTRFTPFCMLRLLADKVDSLPDKLLYLDNDVLCRESPEELFGQDIEGFELAGVLDYYGSWLFRKKWYQRDYINSGVLLLNMKEIKENQLFTRCRELCREKKMFMPDQSAINKLAQKKKILPRKYNEQRRLKRSTCFLHFTTGFRLFPWLHTVTIKPWDLEGVHNKLKLHEFDDIYEVYEKVCIDNEQFYL